MPKRLIETARLSRARKISKKSVLESVIVQKDPLICYTLVQGSDKDPYVVILDLDQMIIGHTCFDFDGRKKWCKHIGRLLLDIPSEYVDEIVSIKSRLEIVRDKEKLKKTLEEIKEKIVAERTETGIKISLDERIGFIRKNFQNNKPITELTNSILPILTEELNQSDNFLVLLRMYKILSEFEGTFLSEFLSQTNGIFSDTFNRILSDYEQKFWNSSTLLRLETGFYIKRLSKQLDNDLNLKNLYYPLTLTIEDKTDALIVFEFLFNKKKKVISSFQTKMNLKLDEKIKKKRLTRIKNSIGIRGTVVKGISTWVSFQEKKILDFRKKQEADDFLIYLMKASGERPIYDVSFGGYQSEHTYISNSLLMEYPTFKYIISNIKESERDYITKIEHDGHQKFFKWLRGKEISFDWVERPRNREPEPVNIANVFMVQWGVEVRKKIRRFVRDGAVKLLPDTKTALTTQIQPFDITLCHTEKQAIDMWNYYVQPITILMPDQVINLITRGIPILSDVLPWDVFSSYCQYGFVAEGKINKAMTYCKSMRVIYGSLDLEKILKSISLMIKRGMDNKDYQNTREELLKDTGRLNVRSRELCNDLLQGEGEVLQKCMDFFPTKDKFLIFILKITKSSSSIQEFRVEFSKEFLKMVLKSGMIKKELLTLLKDPIIGPYQDINSEFAKTLQKSLQFFKKNVKKGFKESKRSSNLNLVKNLIFEDLGISTYDSSYKEKVKKRVDELETFLIN